MLKSKKQLSKLYWNNIWGGLSLSGAWVAILAARGFSLVEIGFAETMYHVTSILFEIPSGALADVFGRKRMLIVSALMRMIGNLIMILSWNFPMVCLSIMFNALSNNFASGTDDALAYDSLKLNGEETFFERYNSNQLVLYRVCGGISTLCAGVALMVGYRIAYGTGVFMGILQMVTAASLEEVYSGVQEKTGNIRDEMVKCFRESFRFFCVERKIAALMFCNALVGAGDVLLLFFLQAKLPACGMPKWGLGPALLFMEMGGVVGAKLILRFDGWRYRKVAMAAGMLVVFGFLTEHLGIYLLMTLGGFLTAVADDALQVRTNARIQNLAPSEQRATITSVDSFLYSMVMIVLSPLAGIVFTVW